MENGERRRDLAHRSHRYSQILKFSSENLEVSQIVRIFAPKKATDMDTKKFKQVPSINKIGKRNPNIPSPVIVNCGHRKHTHERTITRAMRTNSRPISAGEPINWDEVYS